jgi:hypothetical protein
MHLEIGHLVEVEAVVDVEISLIDEQLMAGNLVASLPKQMRKLNYRQKLRSLYLVNKRHQGQKPKRHRSNHDNKSDVCQSLKRRILPPGLTRTSTTDTTNVPSVQVRCRGTPRCGLVTHAGLRST